MRRLGSTEASVAEIRAATRALRREAHGGPARESPAVRAIVAALPHGPLREIHVRLAAGKLSFSGIPLAEFVAFSAALAAAKLPATTT